MVNISIWEPRYHDDVVLVAKKKVKDHNRIVFTKAKSLKGKQFYISGVRVKKWPVETNGSIPCYAVPMGELQEFKYEEIW